MLSLIHIYMCEDLLSYYDMFGGGVSEGDQRLVSNIYELREICLLYTSLTSVLPGSMLPEAM